MLATYFKDPRTLAAFQSGPAGGHLAQFIKWLEIRGYRRACIRSHAREAHRCAAWAQADGLTVCDLDQDTLHRYQNALAKRGVLRKPNGDHSSAYHGSRVFVDFLEATGAVISCASPCLAESPVLLLEFMEWMRTQRGVRDSTLSHVPILGTASHAICSRSAPTWGTLTRRVPTGTLRAPHYS